MGPKMCKSSTKLTTPSFLGGFEILEGINDHPRCWGNCLVKSKLLKYWLLGFRIWISRRTIIIIPSGGYLNVAALCFFIFVDPLSFGVLQWISCFLVNLRLNSIGFMGFLPAGNQIWTFYSRKSIPVLVGHFTKWQWGHGFGMWKRLRLFILRKMLEKLTT